jgi:hypothetical protein
MVCPLRWLLLLLALVVPTRGLTMIGGDLSLSSGDYFGTPVADALPVELLPPVGEADRLLSIEPWRAGTACPSSRATSDAPRASFSGCGRMCRTRGRSLRWTEVATLPIQWLTTATYPSECW